MLLALLLAACSGAADPTPPASTTLACDATNPKRCDADADCACGTDRATGSCAYGTAACIDSDRQCPDFCSGITGTMQLICDAGVCTQRLGTR